MLQPQRNQSMNGSSRDVLRIPNDETWHSYALPKAHMVPIFGSADFLDAIS